MVKTSGAVRRIDLAQAVKLLPPLFAEWARLEFDGSGAVINPITREPMSALALVAGRHRAPDARYRVTIETPRPDGSGVDVSTSFVTLTKDDAYGMAATISEDRGRWAVNVDIQRGVLPRIEAAGWVDLTAMIKDEVGVGCLAGLLGGSGEGSATLDLATLTGQGGRLFEANGHANRFRGAGRADVVGSAAEWKLDAALSLRARGLGRAVLLVMGRRIRRALEDQIKRYWESAADRVTTAETDLRLLATEVERVGGEEEFVHRALWDPNFDPPRPGAQP